MSDLINGLYPKQKHENAPDFVIGKLSINVSQFRDWMKGYLAENPNEEWINIDMKTSKSGKGYAAIDDWKPNQPANEPPPAKPAPQAAAEPDGFEDSSIPF